ncbi:MAG: diguanylate cyclase [Clostridium sp.]
MRKSYFYIGITIIITIIMTSFLVIETSLFKPKKLVNDNSIISMDTWTYTTDYNDFAQSATLPWRPNITRPNSVIFMKSKLPIIEDNKCLLIDSYMKNIKVSILGETIFDSTWDRDIGAASSIGRGLYFVDIPRKYSGEEIEIAVSTPFTQKQGEVNSIAIGEKAGFFLAMVKDSGVENAVAATMIFIGLICIMIYLVTFYNSKIYFNLACIGVFVLLFGFWIVGSTSLYQIVYNNPYIGYIIESFSYYAMPIPILIFLIATYNIREKRLVVGLIGAFTTFLFTVIVCHTLGIFKIHQCSGAYNIILLAAFILVTYVLTVEIRRGNKEIRIFALGAIAMLICGSVEIVLFFTTNIKTPVGIYLLGLVIFICAIAFSMAKYIIKLNFEKVRNRELKHLVYRDISTGVFNRTKFDEDMNRLNKKLGTNASICIIVVDVDNLKRTNDTEGHLEGDRLICETASILQRSFFNVGTVYRIGGDEFVVICVNQDQLTIDKCELNRGRIVEEIRNKTCKYLAMSTGRAYYRKEFDDDMYCVFARADKLMYENKNQRKKQIIMNVK